MLLFWYNIEFFGHTHQYTPSFYQELEIEHTQGTKDDFYGFFHLPIELLLVHTSTQTYSHIHTPTQTYMQQPKTTTQAKQHTTTQNKIPLQTATYKNKHQHTTSYLPNIQF